MYDRPIAERHRLVFYVGHLEAFDWNHIGARALAQHPVSEELDTLFAFGIDPPPGQLPQDLPSDWPSLKQAKDYVQSVRKNLDRHLSNAPEHALHIALEHRLMHAETLTYLLHNLDYSRRLTRPCPITAQTEAPIPVSIRIPAGAARLGLKRGEAFGWDNEFEQQISQVPAFQISKYKVTNAQYLEFVHAGAPAPHYWIERGERWLYRGFHGEVPLPSAAPVYVSYVQAESYARWAGKELPTEAQFHRAAFGTANEGERRHPWGHELPERSHGSFGFQYSDPLPVNATPAGDSAFGVAQLVGNGWEWTSTPFAPFPGFVPDTLYPQYSAPFFDGDHHVVKGASCATDTRFLRSSFRNWFRKQYPYAYTTFRIVEN